jgi:MFS family permease
MQRLRDLVFGPGRAVPVLCVTQILTWGILIYPPVPTMPHIAAAHGWSLAFSMAGFSFSLIVSGLLSPLVGGLIDRYGGNVVMASGAMAGAAGLSLFTLAVHPVAYFACWLLMGASMSATLYDPAFTTLTRIFGATARRQITFVTFAGGFASTVGWPATHFLLAEFGWRGTYLAFAAIFACVVAPLHGFALPRHVAVAPLPVASGAAAAPLQSPVMRPHGRPFLLLAAAFALYSFILSGVTSNLLALLERGGLAAGTAVTIGAMFGPAQVASRLADFALAGQTQPLWIARGAVALVVLAFATLALAGVSFPVAAGFAIVFGAANGVLTIARGALPLLMFGQVGYGRVIGRIARPALFVQAFPPFVAASAVETLTDRTVLMLATLAAVAVLACFLAIRAPGAAARSRG